MSRSQLVNGALVGISICTGLLAYKIPEIFLLNRFSLARSQLNVIDTELERAGKRPIALLGDSTARSLQPNAGGAIDDPLLVNIGAGGSRVDTWRLLLLRALSGGATFGSVVVMMTGGGNSLMRSPSDNPYWPFIAGREELMQQPSAAWRRLFPLSVCSTEVAAVLGDALVVELGNLVREQNQRSLSQNSGTPLLGDPELELRNLLAVLEKAKISALFVSSPAASRNRDSEEGGRGAALFQSLCSRYGMRCKDLSSALPDEVFEFDGVHVKAQKHPGVMKLIKDAAR